MTEIFGLTLEWWLIWAIVGAVLLVLDMLAGSVILIWLGIGAAVVSLITFLLAPPLWGQLMLFALLSLLLVLVWVKVVKPKRLAQNLARARSELPGHDGLVIDYNPNQKRGTLRLQKPICGSDVWEFASDRPTQSGDHVTIDEVDDVGIITLKAPRNAEPESH